MLSEELNAAIKAAVLADQAPEIIEVVRVTIKDESDRLMREWNNNRGYDEVNKAEEAAARKGAWKEWERNQRNPLWCWWAFFGYHLEYTILSMREHLAQREMTKGQIDDLRKAEEIEKKRAELSRLEKSEA